MTVDYRVYLTLYALLALAWCAIVPMIGRARPETVDRTMVGVMGAFLVLGFLNFSDWLWS